jgi:hypothetical protein
LSFVNLLIISTLLTSIIEHGSHIDHL